MGGRDQIDWDDEDFFNVLDGFDEVDDESRVKILRALKQGHVDDDDWIGVSHFRSNGTQIELVLIIDRILNVIDPGRKGTPSRHRRKSRK